MSDFISVLPPSNTRLEKTSLSPAEHAMSLEPSTMLPSTLSPPSLHSPALKDTLPYSLKCLLPNTNNSTISSSDIKNALSTQSLNEKVALPFLVATPLLDLSKK